jgi:hypothetical protein
MVVFGFLSRNVSAMPDTTAPKLHTTILLPLYLDSMFKYGSYKYGNTIPKFALSALEFYNGVQMAADSLRQEGILARIEVVDSRRYDATQKLFASYNHNKPQLVIGVLQSAAELKNLAGMALQNNTPLISATYPNDGGVVGNPKLMIVNSTLKTHCAALYKYLQKNVAGQNLLLFTRQGGVDDRIKNYLLDAENSTDGAKLNWRIVSLPDTFSAKQLAFYLDSTKQNAAIGASLDDEFGLRLVRNLSSLRPSYKASVYGMPTWDELNLTKAEYKGVDVYFSTAFVSYSANADLYASISRKFKKIANSRPSDMVYKGFELTYRYVKTLAKYPDTFMQHLNDPACKVFADFDFEEVKARSNSDNPDYWENKKLYFIKKTDGAVKGVY